MKVYKEKQYLVFELTPGRKVKYDLAAHQSIGLKGGVVNGLSSQLRGYTIEDVIDGCLDPQYAKFLNWVKRCYSDYNGYAITNIGTILRHVTDYPWAEQYFSAGLDDVSSHFARRIRDVPTGLIRICREHKICLEESLFDAYKEMPDALNTAFSSKYISLNANDVLKVVTNTSGGFTALGYQRFFIFAKLITDYGYNAKSLMEYIDRIKTYEAIEDMTFFTNEFYDYCKMMRQVNPGFDKYPKHFLTTHKIAARNYNRLKQEFDEKAFKKRINTDMEYNYKEYCFIYPKSVEDIKREAVSQNNCVASYIDRVINGDCDILFLRYRNTPDESLVTIEVREGQIVQARQHYNYLVTESQQQAIDAWNAWWAKKQKQAA